MHLFQAELLDLRAAATPLPLEIGKKIEPNLLPIASQSQGIIIDARVDKGRGPVATAIIRWGTLSVGDLIGCSESETAGHVRQLRILKGVGKSDKGGSFNVNTCGPSDPVEITGFRALPVAGDTFLKFDTENALKQVFVPRRKRESVAWVTTKALHLSHIGDFCPS